MVKSRRARETLSPALFSYPTIRLADYPSVFRRQRLVPLEQLRLPAPQRDLPAADEHVDGGGGELEGIAGPHHDIRHFTGLERPVAIGHAEHFSGRERHRPQRL